MIREMRADDAQRLSDLFTAQGWQKPVSLFQTYLKEQAQLQRRILVAESEESLIGYVTIVPLATAGPFSGKYPEIKDFNVLEKYQGLGYGRALLAAAEKQVAELSDVATLGVGLHSDYGAAQKLYVHSGYLPDGSGVWHRNQPLGQSEPCANDDELVLYFSKQLRL